MALSFLVSVLLVMLVPAAVHSAPAAGRVTVVQWNGFGGQYLTLDHSQSGGLGVALHESQNDAENFILAATQDTTYLQVFNSPNTRLGFTQPVVCGTPSFQTNWSTPTVSTSGTGSAVQVVSDHGSGSPGVMIYFEDNSSGSRYYLRVNVFGGDRLEVVCQDYVDQAIINGGFSLLELHFNLISVSIQA